MPALSSTVTEGKIVSWVKSEGDVLSKGKSIIVFESDKADMDVETFYDGILTAIVVGEARPPRVGWRLLGFVDVSRGPRCLLEQLGMAVLASKPFGNWLMFRNGFPGSVKGLDQLRKLRSLSFAFGFREDILAMEIW
ncbi:hypothetical protein ACFX13_027747 [Malus domestica]